MATNHSMLNSADQPGAAAAALRALISSYQACSAAVLLRAERPDCESEIAVPAEALPLFAEVLDQLALGRSQTAAPAGSEITDQQAADLLNVSFSYMVRLLDEGKLPHRRVGDRRHVRIDDLLAYKRRDDGHRKKALARLTAQAQQMGLGY